MSHTPGPWLSSWDAVEIAHKLGEKAGTWTELVKAATEALRKAGEI